MNPIHKGERKGVCVCVYEKRTVGTRLHCIVTVDAEDLLEVGPRLPVNAMEDPSVEIVGNFFDEALAYRSHDRVIGELPRFESGGVTGLSEMKGGQQQDGSGGK